MRRQAPAVSSQKYEFSVSMLYFRRRTGVCAMKTMSLRMIMLKTGRKMLFCGCVFVKSFQYKQVKMYLERAKKEKAD